MYNECSKRASFNLVGLKPIFCNDHKEDEMINVNIQLCEHGKRKSTCRECPNNSYCIHNCVKYLCKECKGKSICPHNKRRTRCKECKGGSLCEHGRFKSKCNECNENKNYEEEN
jgi:hypothetical protein